MEFLSRVLKGLVVGVANIIPGVSGGTMAVVMGIYDRLIGAVSDLRRDFKNSLLYLFPIGIGAVLGIVLFSHLIKFLLEGYPMPTNLFFLGLILGSIPMIFRRARKESFQKSSLLPFAVSFAVMLLMTIFQNVSDASSALITTLTPLTAIRLLLSAAVAAACMIMPGISGSMVMVLLGIAFSLVPSAMWPSVPKIIPYRMLGTSYSMIFWIQNWGLSFVPMLIGYVLDCYCVSGTMLIDGIESTSYDYTLPMMIFAGFGVLSIVFALLLRREDRIKGYGLERPNIEERSAS